MRLRFRVLGTIRAVAADGSELPIPNGAPAGVIARLLLRPGDWVGGDELLAAQWPESERAAAQHSLHVAVSSARRSLGPLRGLVENRRGAYRVAVAPAEVDVHAFRAAVAEASRLLDDDPAEAAGRARAALALARNEPFAALVGEDFDAERASHRRAVAEARTLVLEQLLATGRWDEAVAETLAALADMPAAGLWEALVRAEFLRGGPEPALRRLDEAEQTGAASWGLQRLRRAVLDGDRAFVLAPRADRAVPPRAAPAAGDVDILEIAAAADRELRGVEPSEAVAVLDRRYPHVAAALAEAWRDRRFDRACALVAGLHRYWHLRGACDDGTRWLCAALGRPELAGGERAACRETLAALLEAQGRADAAAYYAGGAPAPAADDDPAGTLLRARAEVARAATQAARGRLARALLAAGRDGEAVIESAGLVADAAAADDRLALADGLEVLAAADPDHLRAGRAAGAAASLAWRLGRRPPGVAARAADGWQDAWRSAWESVAALPDRGPTPAARDVLEVVWGR